MPVGSACLWGARALLGSFTPLRLCYVGVGRPDRVTLCYGLGFPYVRIKPQNPKTPKPATVFKQCLWGVASHLGSSLSWGVASVGE